MVSSTRMIIIVGLLQIITLLSSFHFNNTVNSFYVAPSLPLKHSSSKLLTTTTIANSHRALQWQRQRRRRRQQQFQLGLSLDDTIEAYQRLSLGDLSSSSSSSAMMDVVSSSSIFDKIVSKTSFIIDSIATILPTNEFSIALSIYESIDEVLSTITGLDDIITLVSSIDVNKIPQQTKYFISHELIPYLHEIQVTYNSLPLPSKIIVSLIPLLTLFIGILVNLSYPNKGYRNGYEPYERCSASNDPDDDTYYDDDTRSTATTTKGYDPIQAKVYYSKHPILVLQRTLQLLRYSNKFLINILLDKYIFKTDEDSATRTERANELLVLINKAGPTAIKVGQALSVRPDLIPSEYANVLSTLQDRVPSFSAEEAKEILIKELGPTHKNTIKQLLRDLSLEKKEEPVASASIGQVYRGYVTTTTTTTTTNGDNNSNNNDSYKDGGEKIEVAMKIQRPNVLSEIALDLYIVREFAPIYRKLTKTNTDLQALADEWGRGFINELSYIKEASNTKRFNKEMVKRGYNAVTAPIVIDEYTTDRILTTKWINGERLDISKASDIPRLCSVALNAYLVMLLELQTLHCDPHPGNLLRTDDGKLCILDWGMTIDTDPNLQYSLLDFVAHLTSESYDTLPEDLVELGFLKRERLDTVRASGFLEPLTYFLKQAGKGGGAKKTRERIFDKFREQYPNMSDDELRVQMRSDMRKQIEKAREQESVVSGITMEVEELQRRNRDAFSIPEWFLYTSRAFLTLEGVSLQADENYSIVKSCFPYVARRLLGDDSPRARKALKDLLYGASDAIDVDRLSDLADGFSTYTTTTKTINQQANAATLANGAASTEGNDKQSYQTNKSSNSFADAEAAITLAKDSADILLAPDGNLVQNLLLTESALATSAQVKDALRDAFVDGPKRLRDSIPLGVGSFLPPLPLIEDGIAPFVQKTSEEEKAQILLEKFAKIIPQPPEMSPLPFPTGIRSSNGKGEDSNNNNGMGGAMHSSGDTVVDQEQSLLNVLNNVEAEEVALVAKELRENLPRYIPLIQKLGGKFTSTLLATASENIDSTLVRLEAKDDEDQPDQLIRFAAKGVSNVAKEGANVIIDQTTK